jgi:hypothetical protein
MKRLYLSAGLIAVTIASLVAMQPELERKILAKEKRLADLKKESLERQEALLIAFRDDLKAATDQGAQELEKYERNEDTLSNADLLIFKFDPKKYKTKDTPEALSTLLDSLASIMKSTYDASTYQFENTENWNPAVNRTHYSPNDYISTYDMCVIPLIENQLNIINEKMNALESEETPSTFDEIERKRDLANQKASFYEGLEKSLQDKIQERAQARERRATEREEERLMNERILRESRKESAQGNLEGDQN